MLKYSPKERRTVRIEVRKVSAYVESRKATPRTLTHFFPHDFLENQGDRLIDYLCAIL